MDAAHGQPATPAATASSPAREALSVATVAPRTRTVADCIVGTRVARRRPLQPVAMPRATGTFDVKLAPQPSDDYADGGMLGRLTIDKQFRGDLTGASKGQMLSAGTPVKGSAGYVAMELVTGTLAGRSGTFVFQHSGTMDRGAASLSLTVVPDSGTAELTGLTGDMKIDIANGKHSYLFEYALPDAT